MPTTQHGPLGVAQPTPRRVNIVSLSSSVFRPSRMALELFYRANGGSACPLPGGPSDRAGVAAATAPRWDLLATLKVDVPQMLATCAQCPKGSRR